MKHRGIKYVKGSWQRKAGQQRREVMSERGRKGGREGQREARGGGRGGRGGGGHTAGVPIVEDREFHQNSN